MPNWCSNDLHVKGEVVEVIEFIEDTHVKTDKGEYEFSFERINPTPVDDNGEHFDQWYDWRNKNWGTKWDACDCYSIIDLPYDDTQYGKSFKKEELYDIKSDALNRKDENGELITSFSTAWAPPFGIYDTMRSKYKDTDLEFQALYHEGGIGFCGEYSWTKGKIVEDNQLDTTEEDGVEFTLKHCYDDLENILDNIQYILDDKYENDPEMADKLYKAIENELTEQGVTDKQIATMYVSILKEQYEDNKNTSEAEQLTE